MKLDIQKIRADFPILHQRVNGHPLIYFDNAATSQKPNSVIDALTGYYHSVNSNIHRGAHALADRATAQYEQTREAARQFINAKHVEEIIFTRGTTEGLNLIAQTFGRQHVHAGDEVIISGMEHHSNIVPWQMLCTEKGATLRVIPVTDSGELDMEAFKRLLSPKTKLVSLVHVSNVLGTINPIEEVIKLAHAQGVPVSIDGAQSSIHCTIDVQALDCDFYAFSSHKVYGPTGIGILYGKKEVLEAMPPYMGGGEMIKEVSFEGTTFNDLPYKYEAGTPNIGDTIALKEAFAFVNRLGKETMAAHEDDLLRHASKRLTQEVEGLRIIGTSPTKVSVVSFIIDGVHHYDLGMMLDAQGIAIRTGHHCAQPLMKRFGISGTSRASFAVYNTLEEVDTFVEAVKQSVKMLR